MPKKLTYEYVKGKFERENYKLLSERYINSKQKLYYICPNGHKHFITWNNWQQGRRCYYCFGNIQPTIKFIKKKFEKEGYILLTNEYVNAHQKLSYICPNGHKHDIKWNHWQRGHRCPYCVGIGKLTIEFIKEEFEKENYKLLIKNYINARQKLNYICSKGHKHSITWDMWQRGQRCFTCWNLRRFGIGNPNWKGGISCEPYCDIWLDKDFKQSIKDRDGNKCLNPDCWKNCDHLPLHIHHIDDNKKKL